MESHEESTWWFFKVLFVSLTYTTRYLSLTYTEQVNYLFWLWDIENKSKSHLASILALTNCSRKYVGTYLYIVCIRPWLLPCILSMNYVKVTTQNCYNNYEKILIGVNMIKQIRKCCFIWSVYFHLQNFDGNMNELPHTFLYSTCK